MPPSVPYTRHSDEAPNIGWLCVGNISMPNYRPGISAARHIGSQDLPKAH